MGTRSTSVTILFLGLVLSGVVPAAEHQSERGSPMEKMMGMMKQRMEGKDSRTMGGGHMMTYSRAVLAHAEELKLSDEQMGKIMRIELRHRTEHKKIMRRMHKSMHQARRGLMDPAADLAEIRKASKEHSQAHEEMIEDRIKVRDEVHAVLTPEQLDRLKSLMNQKHEKSKGHKRHHP